MSTQQSMGDIGIPHELIADILSRLPPKSLCKFRCVSKPWSNLILDSNFVHMHLSRAITRDERDLLLSDVEPLTKHLEYNLESDDGTIQHTGIGEFLFYTTLVIWVHGASLNTVMKIRDPFGEFFCYDTSKILASCNGVVCLVNRNRVCLLNPCTREYKIVAFHKEVDFFRKAAYGFGYDAIEDDYKLVQIVDTQQGDSEFHVYSLNDASTNKIFEVPYKICSIRSGNSYSEEKQFGCYVNGAIYWPVETKFKCIEQVIVFEVGTDEVREIPRPDSLSKDADFDDEENYYMACLTEGVVGGRLALFKRSYDYIDMWVLETDDAKYIWCQVFSIKKSYSIGLRVRPLYFTGTGEVLIKDDKHLVMHDLRKMTERDIVVQGVQDFSQMERLIIHCPSLVPLKSGLYAENIIGVEVEEGTQ